MCSSNARAYLNKLVGFETICGTRTQHKLQHRAVWTVGMCACHAAQTPNIGISTISFPPFWLENWLAYAILLITLLTLDAVRPLQLLAHVHPYIGSEKNICWSKSFQRNWKSCSDAHGCYCSPVVDVSCRCESVHHYFFLLLHCSRHGTNRFYLLRSVVQLFGSSGQIPSFLWLAAKKQLDILDCMCHEGDRPG